MGSLAVVRRLWLNCKGRPWSPQLSAINEQLTAFIDGSGSPSAAQLHALQRHREVLGDYTVDFRKTKVCVIAQFFFLKKKQKIGNVLKNSKWN
jgi:hypothetical protein